MATSILGVSATLCFCAKVVRKVIAACSKKYLAPHDTCVHVLSLLPGYLPLNLMS